LSRIGLGKRDVALLGISIAALIGVTSFRVYEHFEIAVVRQHIHETHEAAYYTGELIEDLLDAETGQRGYLLTNSLAYLQPYGAAMHAIPVSLKAFQESAKAVGIEPERYLRVQKVAARKIQELSTTVALYQRGNKREAIGLVHSGLGNQLMQQLRRDCDALRTAYFQLAERESLRVDQRNANGLWISLIGNGGVSIILIFAAIRLNESFLRQTGLLAQVSENRCQYQLLVERLHTVREDERSDLAREIHDVLGQSLTAIKLDLTMTIRHLTKPNHDVGATTKSLTEATEEVDELIRCLRRISSDLRPALLDQLGLFPSMEAYAREWEQRTGIKTEMQLPSTRVDLSSKERIALFRIFQESLTNVVRHACASRVAVSASADSGCLAMQIEDDGIGFEPEVAAKKSLGLLGMQERARLIGAELRLDSRPGQGAMVRILLQLQGTAALNGSLHNNDTAYSAG
jgi:signal transduction histidine kinase